MKPNETQLEKVRKHLQKYKTITSWEAIVKYKITRLSQYILILRQSGLGIKSERIQKDKVWYVKYKLAVK